MRPPLPAGRLEGGRMNGFTTLEGSAAERSSCARATTSHPQRQRRQPPPEAKLAAGGLRRASGHPPASRPHAQPRPGIRSAAPRPGQSYPSAAFRNTEECPQSPSLHGVRCSAPLHPSIHLHSRRSPNGKTGDRSHHEFSRQRRCLATEMRGCSRRGTNRAGGMWVMPPSWSGRCAGSGRLAVGWWSVLAGAGGGGRSRRFRGWIRRSAGIP